MSAMNGSLSSRASESEREDVEEEAIRLRLREKISKMTVEERKRKLKIMKEALTLIDSFGERVWARCDELIAERNVLQTQSTFPNKPVAVDEKEIDEDVILLEDNVEQGEDAPEVTRIQRNNKLEVNIPPRVNPVLRQLSDSSLGPLSKEKRTPKANPTYINQDFVSGQEKLPVPEKSKGKVTLKRNLVFRGEAISLRRQKVEAAREKRMKDMLKMCVTIVKKLLSHKYGWIFAKPVDPVELNIPDYFTIIKEPMDFGTVNRKLRANAYKTPADFAKDMRLTFSNALTYNPPHTDVHGIAKEMSNLFESQFSRVESKVAAEKIRQAEEEQELSVIPVEKDKEFDELRKRLQILESQVEQGRTRGGGGKGRAAQKPKKDDTEKRPMTFDEKRKLSQALGRLPEEKLGYVVDIISAHKPEMQQDEDEIELDIDALDNETLWALNHFISDGVKLKTNESGEANVKEEQDQQDEMKTDDHFTPASATGTDKGGKKASSATSASSEASSSESESGSDSDNNDPSSKANARSAPKGPVGSEAKEGQKGPPLVRGRNKTTNQRSVSKAGGKNKNGGGKIAKSEPKPEPHVEPQSRSEAKPETQPVVPTEEPPKLARHEIFAQEIHEFIKPPVKKDKATLLKEFRDPKLLEEALKRGKNWEYTIFQKKKFFRMKFGFFEVPYKEEKWFDESLADEKAYRKFEYELALKYSEKLEAQKKARAEFQMKRKIQSMKEKFWKEEEKADDVEVYSGKKLRVDMKTWSSYILDRRDVNLERMEKMSRREKMGMGKYVEKLKEKHKGLKDKRKFEKLLPVPGPEAFFKEFYHNKYKHPKMERFIKMKQAESQKTNSAPVAEEDLEDGEIRE